MLKAKTILVSGAAGFIASSLIDVLVRDPKIKVIGIDNFNNFYDQEIKIGNCLQHFDKPSIINLINSIDSPYRDFLNSTNTSINKGFSQNNLVSLEKNNYKFYGLDLCDYTNLRKVFLENDITHVVNIAALAGVRPSTEKPLIYLKNNGESTANLLELAKKFNIKKVIHASSSSVYGSRSTVPFKEDDDISKPISPYAASKVADEARLHCFFHLHKIPTIALRFFTVYGPRQRPDLAITKFTKQIDNNEVVTINGDGSYRRDFTYIEDILDGLIKAIDLDCGYEIFNLGESQTTDVLSLVRLIENELNKEARLDFGPEIPGDAPITFADITKAKTLLKYNPQTKIEVGIKKYVSWYKNKQ